MSRSHRRGGHLGQLNLFSATPAEERTPAVGADPPASRTIRGPSPALRPVVRESGGADLLPRLAAVMTTPVCSLTLTRNRTRIVSARPRRPGEPGLDVRIHRCFTAADDGVLKAVADLLDAPSEGARKRGLKVIREYFRHHGQDDTPQPRNLRPKGQWLDLETLRDRVNRDYFSDRLDVDITWGREAKSRRRRKGAFSIRLGSYDERLRLVRIHPVLDRREVPEYVVESIVYHEMLHAVVPPRPGAERRSVHPPEFRRLEKLYARYEEAEAWISANVERLAKLR